jgi:sodium/potassium-transporting ATPase subunit alpha
MSMKIHQLSVADALVSVQATEQGLSPAQVQHRQREFGLNRMAHARRRSWLRALLKEFVHFFSIVLWLAALLAFIAEWKSPGQGMARLGYALILVILVSGLFSFWQEYRAERALSALRRLLPQQAQVLRDGSVLRVATEALVPGDIVLFAEGDRVPADCRVIEAFSLQVNNAPLTGESTAEARDAQPSGAEDWLYAGNIVLTGTAIMSGKGRGVVFATGMHTEFGRIAHLTQASGAETSPLRREVAHLSRSVLILALGIGVIFFCLGMVLGMPFWSDFIFTIGLIVAMVPEGLLPTLTLSLVLATQRMARRQVLIRHLPSVEALGSTTVICTDKTGTLTQNRMTVTALWLDGSLYGDLEQGLPVGIAQANAPFFQVAGLCHDLQQTGPCESLTYLGDPMEQALFQLVNRIAPTTCPVARLHELPFNAERMRMSVVYAMADGPRLLCKGALEKVLPLCTGQWRDGAIAPLTDECRAHVLAAQTSMADRGLRVLALAWRDVEAGPVPVEQTLVLAGLVGLQDPPRPEVSGAISACQAAGIKVIMVTGDNPHTALAIAREVGLVRSDAPQVLTGAQLLQLSDAQLQLALDAAEIICARIAPEQKLRIVETLKRKGEIVAVTGDGVNDAPALKSAHVGIAMGLSGTDVAREVADMVLLDDNFASIVNAVEEGRAVFDNIRKFLTYILAHNMAELIPYLGFVLIKLPLAITPLQMLAIDMGTDTLTALGLGVERPDPQIMQRPPRPPGERLFNLGVALRGYVALGLFEALATVSTFIFVLHRGGWAFGDTVAFSDPLYHQATTGSLAAIVVLQVVNVFLCRSATRSVFDTGLRGNPLILWGVVLEIVLILFFTYSSWGNALLGTAPLPFEVWLFLLPFALLLIGLEEARKAFVRRRCPSP